MDTRRKIILTALALSPFCLGMIWWASNTTRNSGASLPLQVEPISATSPANADAPPKASESVSLTQPTLQQTPPTSVASQPQVTPLDQTPTPPITHNSTTPRGGAVPTSQPVQVAVGQKEGCFEITFKHRAIASHSDGEACLKHSNLIILQNPKLNLVSAINPSSVCIEVNGEVVKFKKVPGHPEQFIIGPEAGPNATITARGCLGKSQCTKKCVLKTDHFMKSLGLEENPEQANARKNWNGTSDDTQEDTALNKEVKESHALLNSSAETSGETLFSGWISDRYSDLNCEKGGSYANKGVHVSQRTTQ
ncbi:MAG: hypothetical protein HYX41_06360 [Bdellovibrio sp.]|nr:hypothetical protein [Bdellovibrio sp.]